MCVLSEVGVGDQPRALEHQCVCNCVCWQLQHQSELSCDCWADCPLCPCGPRGLGVCNSCACSCVCKRERVSEIRRMHKKVHV